MSKIIFTFQNNDSKIYIYNNKFEMTRKIKLDMEISFDINGVFEYVSSNYILDKVTKINNIETKILINIYYIDHQYFNCAIYVNDSVNFYIPLSLLFNINHINNIKMNLLKNSE